MAEIYTPTLEAARQRIAAVRPHAYVRTRNAIGGAVSQLSPYITHGFVSLADVLAGVSAHHALEVQHKFVYELGWRAWFRHVWQQRGSGILASLHEGLLPDAAYATDLPPDIRQARTGVPVVDQAVRTLYATGMLHNHARMWLASYVVHVRKVHWRCGADWLYAHLLDGDLASNHLSWQWVAGTGSRKPYLFNAANVARYAPPEWHSPGSVVDASYDALDRLARQPGAPAPLPADPGAQALAEPSLLSLPPAAQKLKAPDAAMVAGRDVWLVHPWNLGELPAALSPGSLVLGLHVADFHRAWPWADKRWHFVGARMAELCNERWLGDAQCIGAALRYARSVQSIDEPHLAPWLTQWARCRAAPALFPPVARRCESFSQWWGHATRGLDAANDLLARCPNPALEQKRMPLEQNS